MKRIEFKRILALVLVVFICGSLLFTSCGEAEEPTGGDRSSVDTALPETSRGDDGATDSAPIGGSETDENPIDDSKADGGDAINPPGIDPTEEWRGQTLNVLATTWESDTPSAPWSQAELTVSNDAYDSDIGYGRIINNAVILRNKYITEEYGVNVNWISARSSQIHSLLMEASATDRQKYHIAMPRAGEAQSLVEKSLIYDLANREHIDLSSSYYSQAAIEAYTVNGHTLFVGGDFSFLDELSAYVTFYNASMIDCLTEKPDLYGLVRQGNWTVEEMINVASLFSKNDKEAAWTDGDTYGFGAQGMVQFYGYAGVKQVSVENKQYKLFEDHPYLSHIVDSVLEIKGESWSRTKWEMNPIDAFKEGRVAFYNGHLGEIEQFGKQGETFRVGILPNPMIGQGQTEHYTLAGKATVLVCVPKSTQDREMSEAFVEILAVTGQELITPAYIENIKSHLDPAVADQSVEVLTDHVFGGIIYDQGYINDTFTEAFELKYAGYSGIMPDYTPLIEAATEEVNNWNKNWIDYAE